MLQENRVFSQRSLHKGTWLALVFATLSCMQMIDQGWGHKV